MKKKQPPPPPPLAVGDAATWPDEFGKPAVGTLAEVLVFGVYPGQKSSKPDMARVCVTEAEAKDPRKGYWLPLCMVQRVSAVK